MSGINMMNDVQGNSISHQDLLNQIRKELCSGELLQDGDVLYYRTPLLDFSNDEIVLKIVSENNKITVSDDNRVMLSLLSSGFDPFTTRNREYLIDKIAGSCNVNIERYGEIYAIANGFENVSETVFWMIHAVQRLTSTAMMNKTYRPPSFKNEIIAYLTENKVKYKENPTYYIGKNSKAIIDFESVNTSRDKLFRALSFSGNKVAMTYSEKFMFEVDIISERYKKKFFPVSIIDDISKTEDQEPVFDDDILQILERGKVIPWTEKEELLEVFTS